MSFSQRFSEPPCVTVEVENVQINANVSRITTRGFKIAYYAINGGFQNADTDWVAVGV